MNTPEPQYNPQTIPIWLPLLVGTLLSVLVVLLGWHLKENQSDSIKTLTHERAVNFMDDIKRDLDSRVPALQRIVNRWEIRGGTPKREFESDANYYVRDLPGFQAIEWVDQDFIVRWVVPRFENEAALGLDLGFEETRRLALERAKAGRVPVMSPPVDLVQGGMGILIYFPIYVAQEFKGFVLAVIDTQVWLRYVLRTNEVQDNLGEARFLVKMGDKPIYRQHEWDTTADTPYDGSTARSLFGHRFSIHYKSTPEFIDRTTTYLPEIAVGAGFLFVLLTTFVMYYFQRANTEAWASYAAKVDLERQIMEREEAQAELKALSSRLALATQAGKIGVWTWDIETNKLVWDQRMFELYDVPPDIVPKFDTWKNALHPDDEDHAVTLILAAIEGKAIFDTEFRITVQGGEIRHIHAAARVNRDADGNAVDVVGVNWDITLRKQAEQALEKQRQRLASIIRGTNVGTWEWNVQTGETVFNERWAGIIGYTLNELSPVSIETWMKFAHPDDLEESARLLEQHFNGELEYYEYEARMKHRDGRWVWVLDRGKVSTWTEDGKPLLMAGTHKDITPQKEAEEKIRHLANHDPLTDLPTLRLARDRISMALATAHRKTYFPESSSSTSTGSSMSMTRWDMTQATQFSRKPHQGCSNAFVIWIPWPGSAAMSFSSS